MAWRENNVVTFKSFFIRQIDVELVEIDND